MSRRILLFFIYIPVHIHYIPVKNPEHFVLFIIHLERFKLRTFVHFESATKA